MPTTLQPCSKCPQGVGQVICGGCQQQFCIKHLLEHRQDLSRQMDQLILKRDQIEQNLTITGNDHEHPLLDRVDRWESKSIDRIREVANNIRCRLTKALDQVKRNLRASLSDITIALQQSLKKESYTEIDMDKWMNQLIDLRQQLEQPMTIALTDDRSDDNRSSKTISLIQLRTTTRREVPREINNTSKWTAKGQTIAGGHGPGEALNQLHYPYGLDIDDDGTLFIADMRNHRIVRWRPNATHGEIIAGGTGPGNRLDQLNQPVALLIDRLNRNLIISEEGNRRLTRWSLDTQNQKFAQGQVMILNILSAGLAMDDQGSLYVSDFEKHEVRRHGLRDPSEGVVVAGGHGQGAALNQLYCPRNIFVDADQTVYISDKMNHRVMKWRKDAREGVIVAGGQGQGNSLKQLNCPSGLFVDRMGSVYVVDQENYRVMRWLKDTNEGQVVVGGNVEGSNDDQLSYPRDILFGDEGNLYVADHNNARIQYFQIRRISLIDQTKENR